MNELHLFVCLFCFFSWSCSEWIAYSGINKVILIWFHPNECHDEFHFLSLIILCIPFQPLFFLIDFVSGHSSAKSPPLLQLSKHFLIDIYEVARQRGAQDSGVYFSFSCEPAMNHVHRFGLSRKKYFLCVMFWLHHAASQTPFLFQIKCQMGKSWFLFKLSLWLCDCGSVA